MKKVQFNLAVFFIFLIPLLLIKNEFHMADEYCFAAYLRSGRGIFHPFHVLSLVSGYIWWFLTSILGCNVSAFRILQVNSSIMAAIGAAALVDLGIFLGLNWRNAFLFSLPVLFSNAFIRYGTSAYPEAAAFGLGLVAVNLIIKTAAKPENVLLRKGDLNCFSASGLVCGFTCLLHIVFLCLIPGFILGIIIRLRQCKRSIAQIFIAVLSYCLGLATILGSGYLLLFTIRKTAPGLVETSADTAFLSNILHTPFNFTKIVTAAKTFMAIFFPGVHSSIRILDLLFGIPRILAFLIIVWMFFNAWKARKTNPAVSVWLLSLLFSLISLFFVMFIFNLGLCRQYAAINLSVFGPLFLIIGVLVFKKTLRLFKITIIIISLVVAFHMIFGIEGAIQIIDAKARLVSDLFCDGLGACLGYCPQGAITIEEREADKYDEKKVMGNIVSQGGNVIKAHLKHLKGHNEQAYLKEALDYLKDKGMSNPLAGDNKVDMCHNNSGGCPGPKAMDFKDKEASSDNKEAIGLRSRLSNWPVQLMLVPSLAPYLNNAEILIAADCVAFAYAGFHKDLLKNKVLLVGCPKLDDLKVYKEKITQILKHNSIKSITYAHMEVPCCFGLAGVIKEAISVTGDRAGFFEVVIGIKGDRIK